MWYDRQRVVYVHYQLILGIAIHVNVVELVSGQVSPLFG